MVGTCPVQRRFEVVTHGAFETISQVMATGHAEHRCIPHRPLTNVPSSRVRLRVNVLREAKRALMAKGSRAVPIQAIFRGFLARRDDKLIGVSLPPASRLVCITRALPISLPARLIPAFRGHHFSSDWVRLVTPVTRPAANPSAHAYQTCEILGRNA